MPTRDPVIREKFPFTCIRDFVLIEPVNEAVTKGGIIVPDVVEDGHPLHGIVKSVGCGLIEGGNIIPLVVKEGDRVRFIKHSGSQMKIGDVKYYALRENQIIGIDRI